MVKNFIALALATASVITMSNAFAATKTVTLDVPGMTCSTCPITVKKALMKVDGVQQIATNVTKREAVVTFDDGKTSVSKLAAATANAGYPVRLKVAN